MLEKKEMDESQIENIQKVVSHINEILNIIDMYEGSRQGSFAIMKCEEVVMWIQSMMSNVPYRKEIINPPEENISEINTAA